MNAGAESDGACELEPAAAEPVHHAAERGAPAEGAPARPGEQGPPRPSPAKAAGRCFLLLGAGVVVPGAAGRRGPFRRQRSVCYCRRQAVRQVTERKQQGSRCSCVTDEGGVERVFCN
jgi:hypothetical protein